MSINVSPNCFVSIHYLVFNRGGGKSHMFKSQASLKSLPSSLKQVSSPYHQVSSKSQVTVQTNQASQVKSAAHLKQVKSSPDTVYQIMSQ